jgi:hypothetical protein
MYNVDAVDDVDAVDAVDAVDDVDDDDAVDDDSMSMCFLFMGCLIKKRNNLFTTE